MSFDRATQYLPAFSLNGDCYSFCNCETFPTSIIISSIEQKGKLTTEEPGSNFDHQK
jgi:hypothetical protein